MKRKLKKKTAPITGWIVHRLGGLTEDDILVRTRPVVNIDRFRVEHLKTKMVLRPEYQYPDDPNYEKFVRRELAGRLADRIIADRLVTYEVRNDDPGGLPVVSAMIGVVRPEG